MNNSFTKIADIWRPQVWKLIKSYLPKNDGVFAEAVSEYPRRQGRYIRPALLLSCYEILGGKDSSALLTAAAVQTAGDWLLIHDDIQDKALVRRNMPSLNTIYGDALAINIGDSLHLLMWQMLCDNAKVMGAGLALRIMEEVQRMLYTTTIGQFNELTQNKSKLFTTTEEDYFKIIDQKTSYYTIKAPLRLALLLTKKEKYFDQADKFGRLWGQAFQLRNDLNNLREFKSGVNSDIAEGKRNIPMIQLLKCSNTKEKSEIKKIYSKNLELKTNHDIAFILALMNKYQTLQYTESILNGLVKQTQDAINLFQAAAGLGPEVKILFDALEYTISPES